VEMLSGTKKRQKRPYENPYAGLLALGHESVLSSQSVMPWV